MAALSPGTSADIRIAGVRKGDTASVNYVQPSPWDRPGARKPSKREIEAGKNGSSAPRGTDLEQYRRISAKTILSAAEALIAERRSDGDSPSRRIGGRSTARTIWPTICYAEPTRSRSFSMAMRGQRRKVYHLAETSRLPIFRLGSVLCARRTHPHPVDCRAGTARLARRALISPKTIPSEPPSLARPEKASDGGGGGGIHPLVNQSEALSI